MSLLDNIKRDVKQIVGNSNEFAIALTFIAPNGTTVTINGLHTKHHNGIDTDGNMVNSKKAHVSFYESTLAATSYPSIRNAAGQIALQGHRIKAKDSTGTLCDYVIQEWFPDETLGLIVCILDDYE